MTYALILICVINGYIIYVQICLEKVQSNSFGTLEHIRSGVDKNRYIDWVGIRLQEFEAEPRWISVHNNLCM